MEIPLVLTFSAFGMELDEVYATPTPQEKLRGEAELPQHLQKPEVRLRWLVTTEMYGLDRDFASVATITTEISSRDRDYKSRPRCVCHDRDSVSENNGEKIRRAEKIVTTVTIGLDRDADTGFPDLKILSLYFISWLHIFWICFDYFIFFLLDLYKGDRIRFWGISLST